MSPPITPKLMSASPARVANAGMMVCIGRLPGPTWFGCPGVSRKHAPRFCRLMPVSGTTTPEPKPM